MNPEEAKNNDGFVNENHPIRINIGENGNGGFFKVELGPASEWNTSNIDINNTWGGYFPPKTKGSEAGLVIAILYHAIKPPGRVVLEMPKEIAMALNANVNKGQRDIWEQKEESIGNIHTAAAVVMERWRPGFEITEESSTEAPSNTWNHSRTKAETEAAVNYIKADLEQQLYREAGLHTTSEIDPEVTIINTFGKTKNNKKKFTLAVAKVLRDSRKIIRESREPHKILNEQINVVQGKLLQAEVHFYGSRVRKNMGRVTKQKEDKSVIYRRMSFTVKDLWKKGKTCKHKDFNKLRIEADVREKDLRELNTWLGANNHRAITTVEDTQYDEWKEVSKQLREITKEYQNEEYQRDKKHRSKAEHYVRKGRLREAAIARANLSLTAKVEGALHNGAYWRVKKLLGKEQRSVRTNPDNHEKYLQRGSREIKKETDFEGMVKLLREKLPIATNLKGALNSPFTHGEVEWAITNRKANKAANPKDGLKYESWKQTGVAGIEWATTIFNTCRVRAELLLKEKVDIKDGVSVLLDKHKTSTNKEPNWRMITLGSTLLKWLEAVTLTRLSAKLSISKELAIMILNKGGTKYEGTTEHLFLTRRGTEQTKAEGGEEYILFVDLAEYFNTIQHTSVEAIMYVLSGGDEKLHNFLKLLIRGRNLQVKHPVRDLLVTLKAGVIQGGILSVLLSISYTLPLVFAVERVNKGAMIIAKAGGAEDPVPEECRIEKSGYYFIDDVAIKTTNWGTMRNVITEVNRYLKEEDLGAGIKKCLLMAYKMVNGKVEMITNLSMRLRDPDGIMRKIPVAKTPDQAYKYLGLWFAADLDDRRNLKVMEEKIMERIDWVKGMNLSAVNFFKFYLVLTISVATFWLNLIKVPKTHIKRLDARIRRKIKRVINFAKASTSMLYSSLQDGGLGYQSIEQKEIICKVKTITRLVHSKDKQVSRYVKASMGVIARSLIEAQAKHKIEEEEYLVVRLDQEKIEVVKRKHKLSIELRALVAASDAGLCVAFNQEGYVGVVKLVEGKLQLVSLAIETKQFLLQKEVEKREKLKSCDWFYTPGMVKGAAMVYTASKYTKKPYYDALFLAKARTNQLFVGSMQRMAGMGSGKCPYCEEFETLGHAFGGCQDEESVAMGRKVHNMTFVPFLDELKKESSKELVKEWVTERIPRNLLSSEGREGLEHVKPDVIVLRTNGSTVIADLCIKAHNKLKEGEEVKVERYTPLKDRCVREGTNNIKVVGIAVGRFGMVTENTIKRIQEVGGWSESVATKVALNMARMAATWSRKRWAARWVKSRGKSYNPHRQSPNSNQ